MNKIEQMFFDALLTVFRNEMNDVGYESWMNVCDYNAILEERIGGIETITYQFPIGIYIVDFLITSTEGLEFVIEIDGHESHKTKEQRFKDYQRERFLQENGKIVFRFMASEIYVNARTCAMWVVRTIDKYNTTCAEKILDAFETGVKRGESNGSNQG
jgi:very-short-patch-repair endonuclease